MNNKFQNINNILNNQTVLEHGFKVSTITAIVNLGFELDRVETNNTFAQNNAETFTNLAQAMTSDKIKGGFFLEKKKKYPLFDIGMPERKTKKAP